MTTEFDPAGLFLAPAAPPAAGDTGTPESAVDDGEAAMHRLRNPFEIPAAPQAEPARDRAV